MALASLTFGQTVGAGAALILVWAFSGVAYNLFFHPLRSYPGPFINRVSRVPYAWGLVRGTLTKDMLAMHNKYGRVVRVAPNELAFNDSTAWKDIHGHRPAGAEEFAKSNTFYRVTKKIPTHVLNAGREEHARLRRQLSHGFSDRSMRDQEPLIKSYIDLLILRLRQHSSSGPLDLAAWFNFITFDIIGDLAFGEAFGCLENSQAHPWVKMIFATARMGALLQATSHFPRIQTFLMSMIPKSMIAKRKQHMAYAEQKLLKRMQVDKERPDLIEGLLRKRDDFDLSFEKIRANSSLLVIAGSETTSTVLSGVTYLLLTNPQAMGKLKQEVRSAFQSDDEISITSVGRLEYLLACLDEALRMYPPVALGMPRTVPKGGAMVSGHYVPEDTIVAIHQYATYNSAANFTDPFTYHPERFLGDPRFANDDREALQPFHIGPRNCLGRNLAYAEMRLIMARLLFNFDLEIADECRDWMSGQKVFNFWEKGPLYVHVTPVTV